LVDIEVALDLRQVEFIEVTVTRGAFPNYVTTPSAKARQKSDETVTAAWANSVPLTDEANRFEKAAGRPTPGAVPLG